MTTNKPGVNMILVQVVISFIPLGVTSQRSYTTPQQLSQVKIGGVFDNGDTESEVILKQAVSHVNRDPSILPNHHLTVVSETLASENSFHTTSNVCKLLQQGVVGIFGPKSTEGASHTQAICDRFDVPHVETRWDYLTRQDKNTLNVFPHPNILGEAYTNFVNYLNWHRFVIIYDSRENMLNLQGLLKGSKPDKREIFLRRFSQSEDYRPLLKSLQRDYDIKHIIVDCELSMAKQVLKQAQEIGMIRFDYDYILTTLDVQPQDLEEFKNGDCKIWAFRMINPENSETETIVRELTSLNSYGRYDQPRGISTAEALIYDAVYLFAKALHENVDGLSIVEPVTCENHNSWAVGSSIMNSMRSMKPFPGLSGLVQFNTSGYRTDIKLQLVGLTSSGLVRQGLWEYARDPTSRTTMFEPEVEKGLPETELMPLQNRTLIVVTGMTKPFCMLARSEEALTGNTRYVGFTVDLLEELRKSLGFEYLIKLGDDGTNDGMVDEVLLKKAHLAIGDLTITKERQEKLEFTMPFMNLGISILFTQPQGKAPSLFSFMSPFATEVWICTIISFLGVSLVLFAVGRFTPYEWENTYPCVTEPVALQNQFTLANSFWFTIGSIMQQGSDLAPKSASTRMIAGTWWCFTLIMVSSYTANLATFLIVQELEYTFSTLKELSEQNVIKYGCVVNGSTSKFFLNSKEPSKQRIAQNMLLMNGNDEGIREVRARPGKFAFFMESTIIEYYMERLCGLNQVGGLLDHKGYGIALPKNSTDLALFDKEILEMQEHGELERLKRKWWKEEGKEEAETCEAAKISDTVKALGLSNVGGVFVVLVCGCICAVILTLIEFLINSHREKSEGGSLFYDILKDLNFALQCRGNVKPVKKPSTASAATHGIAEEDLADVT